MNDSGILVWFDVSSDIITLLLTFLLEVRIVKFLFDDHLRFWGLSASVNLG